MKYDDTGVQFLLFLILLAVWSSADNSVKTIKADGMGCAQYSKPQGGNSPGYCLKRVINASFKISINPGSNACSFYYKNKSYPNADILRGKSLAYVDEDNWVCTSEATDLKLAKKASMLDGQLTIESIDLDGIVGRVIYEIEPSNGILGALKHWYRLGMDKLNVN